MYQRFFKRFIDFSIAIFAIVVLWPIMFLITISLLIANKGAGAFYFHERPGLNNKIFKVIKFKSMTDECDHEGNLLPNEQRITRIGAFIRNKSIDEWPQLINIIKGDMSLIGPRPLPVRYLDLYNDEQKKRQFVRPGLTGWAQVNGRNSLSWTKKFEFDIWYIEHISLNLDMKIFFLTILKVLKGSDIDSSSDKVGAIGFNGKN